MRPVLSPSARPLWRAPTTLQLGLAPGRTAVLDGIDPALRASLALLDGTRDRAQVVTSAAAQGCPAERMTLLLDLLADRGLLEDAGQDRAALADLDLVERERLTADLDSLALVRGDGGVPALEHRRAARVLVSGAGRVGTTLALELAVAGVGTVDVDDDGLTRPQDTGAGGLSLSDVGRSRGEAARALLHEAVPSLSTTALDHPDLVVIAPVPGDPQDDARDLVERGVPHLKVQVRATTGVVGPLVLPGRTPCLRCLELTRSDLDPAWPALSAQLSAGGRGGQACDGPLAASVAAQAAMQVLVMLDGTTDPAALAGTLELTLPDWRWRRRSWPLHPDCGCSAPSP